MTTMPPPACERACTDRPVAHINDNQWQSRALARMVAMTPSIHADEAGKRVAAACAVIAWRELAPEEAAERLLARPPTRS